DLRADPEHIIRVLAVGPEEVDAGAREPAKRRARSPASLTRSDLRVEAAMVGGRSVPPPWQQSGGNQSHRVRHRIAERAKCSGQRGGGAQPASQGCGWIRLERSTHDAGRGSGAPGSSSYREGSSTMCAWKSLSPVGRPVSPSARLNGGQRTRSSYVSVSYSSATASCHWSAMKARTRTGGSRAIQAMSDIVGGVPTLRPDITRGVRGRWSPVLFLAQLLEQSIDREHVHQHLA